MSSRGGNSFLQYMLAQRGARERTGFDQPNPPPPNVQMTGDAGVGVPPSATPEQMMRSAPSAQAAQGNVQGAPQPATPAPVPMAPTEPMAMDMPAPFTNQAFTAIDHAAVADEAWEQSFYRVAGRWPTALERQMGQTMRTTTEQTGRPPSRSELVSSVMLRVLAPPTTTSDFEVAPQGNPSPSITSSQPY